jgi:hypothetical protein
MRNRPCGAGTAARLYDVRPEGATRGGVPTMDAMEVLRLRGVLDGRRIWKSARYLARLGIGAAMLHALEAAGTAQRWERDCRGKPFKSVWWTLTPWGAEALGLGVDEDKHGVPRWVKGEAEGPFRIRQQFAPLKYPNLIPDPRSCPPPRYLLDPGTGEPISIMGREVPIDPRLGKGKPAKRAKKSRQAG